MKIIYKHKIVVTMTEDEAVELRRNMVEVSRHSPNNIPKAYHDLLDLLPDIKIP